MPLQSIRSAPGIWDIYHVNALNITTHLGCVMGKHPLYAAVVDGVTIGHAKTIIDTANLMTESADKAHK